MRRSIYRGEYDDAVTLFRRAPFVHLAGVSAAGEPILRAVHGVVLGDKLCFHAARAGEKLEMLGRPVVAAVQEVVAEIPSYFVDPSLACPATTYYRSAQLKAPLETVEDLPTKTAVMQALMKRFQPEAGYDPIDPEDRRYRPSLKGLLVGALALEGAVAKTKLGQNRRPQEMQRIVEGLWRRGKPGDLNAIRILLRANPKTPTPGFLNGPITMDCAPDRADVDDAAALLRPTHWSDGRSAEEIGDAHIGASAWVGARDAAGRLVATARAVSDGRSAAYVADVVVHPSVRRRGIGKAVVALLLDHPAVRDARRVRLATPDVHVPGDKEPPLL